MTGLPEKLGNLVTILGGGTPARSEPRYWNGDIPWASVKDFSDIELRDTVERITRAGAEASATNIIEPGAVIVPTRMALGKAAINTVRLAINQDLKALLPSKRLHNRYLLHFILSRAKELEGKGVGATVKGIKLDVLQQLDVLLPSPKEQERIAAILDKANSIRRKRQQALAEIDALLRSAYQSLVSAKHPNFTKWKSKKFEDLAAQHKGSMRTGPFGSDLRHSEFVDKGIAVLGIDNAVTNRFAWVDRRYITPAKYEGLRRYRAYPGDVIVTIMGTTGRSAVVPDDIPEAITTKHLATITLDRHLALPEFIAFAIHSDPRIVNQITRANKGAIMDGLNLGIIKHLEIALPPIEDQDRFARVYRKLNAHKARLELPEVNGDELFNSLAQRAFRGEL